MTTQSPIFAIGSMVKDALEKNRKLWLVLQDMRKAYNSTFEQIQAKGKVATVICFANSVRILGWLFMHRLHNLQVLIFLDSGLSLGNLVCDVFHFWNRTPLSKILGKSIYFRCLPFFCHYGIAFRLDLHGPVSAWFAVAVYHFYVAGFFNVGLFPLVATSVKDILNSHEFRSVRDQLSGLGASNFSMYMDGSLCGLRSINMKAGAAMFFENINLGLRVEVFGIVFSILAKLQAIALALECVLSSSSVHLFSDSQAALDAFEHQHIAGIIHDKNLNIGWHKVKSHSDVPSNNRADLLAGVSSHSGRLFHPQLKECFILANDNTVSGNSRHFVCDIFWSIHRVSWEIGSGAKIRTVSGLFHASFHVLQMLSNCLADLELVVSLYKGFVLVDWCQKATSCFDSSKVVSGKVVEFVRSLCLFFKNDILLVHSKHCAYMEKHSNLVSVYYDKSKPFFNYEATVGSVIAVMKKTAKVSGSENGFKAVASKKKRKGDVLAEGVDNRRVAAEVPGVYSWGLETGDTTESESVDMEEECLVEETSFDYGEGGALTGGDYVQTPTSSKVKTKKALGKPLGKIDFSKDGSDNGVLSDAPLELPLSVRNLVNVSVRKSFALDIGLDKVAGKSSQEKLVMVRKLFSGINGFGEASTPSKFSGIIRTTFTSELSLMKATNKAANAKILVNANLKKASG
ncbi:hypothetical protein G9A89_015970 [Geosiphon pyriformis]|nr:hypothetical protein G9A89_015970 [Geosiphon pyriformis]